MRRWRSLLVRVRVRLRLRLRVRVRLRLRLRLNVRCVGGGLSSAHCWQSDRLRIADPPA